MSATQRRASLDLVRGIAAFLVCAFHLRQALFVGYGESDASILVRFPFYLLTGLGHQSVMVFFVLSGFFVGGSVLRQAGAFRIGGYALSRLSRLWTVLIPALVFTYFLDLSIRAVSPPVLEGAFQSIWHSGPVSGQYSTSPWTFLGNVFFLQTTIVPVFGSNGPLWSLMCEFWYYAIFPVVLFLVGWRVPRTGWLARLAGLLAVCACAWAFDQRFWIGFAVWCLGAGLYLLVEKWPILARPQARLHPWIAAAAAAGLLVVSLANRVPRIERAFGGFYDILTGLAAFLFLLAILDLPVGGWLRRFAIWSSDISYSLYLVHFPIVLLIGALRVSEPRWRPEAGSFALFLLAFAFLVAAGHAFWWLFERRTETVKRWMGAAFRVRSGR